MIAVVGRGRVADAVIALLEDTGRSHRRVELDADPSTVEAGCSVVVDAAGVLGHAERLAWRRAGVHVTDARPDQSRLREAIEPSEDLAPGRDVTPGRDVPGAGLQHLVGASLADLAADACGEVEEVHVTYTFPDHRGPLGGASDGRRRLAARQLREPMWVWLDGELVVEPLGEARRLGWFPRPVGPRHATAVPGGEALTVPRRRPQVRTVRTYVAVPGWRAELLQATGNLARWEPVAARLTRRLERRRTDDGRGIDRRWACVAEASGSDGVARAWAYGRAPERLTGTALGLVAGELAEGTGEGPFAALAGGRLTDEPGSEPVDVTGARQLLDELARHTDLRWSRAHPATDAP